MLSTIHNKITYIFLLYLIVNIYLILFQYSTLALIYIIKKVSIYTDIILISSPLSILILCLNSLFIFLFKKWLGPVGIFYNSITVLTIFILFNINTLYNNLLTGTFIYIDLGRWFFTNDLIDSHLIFCFDNLTLTLSIVVSLLTILAQFFGVEYMSREAFIGRLVYLLNLFATSVILLFCVYDFFLILIAWECIGLFSFLLVNFYSTRVYTLKAALKTFIFSRISDMFIFITFVLSVLVFNSTDLTIIFSKTPFLIFHSIFICNISINFLFLYTITISIAASIKGAQFFFHVWLPDAMEAPTPASALIHSSTLVIMGIYLIVRFGLVFEFTLLTNYFLIMIGSLTIAFGAVVASFQIDIKKLVAYSTISQMGYLICGCGFCAYDETILYLILHACNKAFLFILVGYTVHFFTGNTDLRQMGGLYIYSYDIIIFFLLVSLNLIGLPLGTGFYSKEFLLFQIMQDGWLTYLVRSAWFISFCFTPYYMLLLCLSTSYWNKKSLKYIYLDVNVKNNFLRSYLIKVQNVCNIEVFFSTVTSYFTTIFFLLMFIFLNFYGESLIMIVFDITSVQQYSIADNFFKIKMNKSLLLTTAPLTLLETLLIFVLIGLITAVKFSLAWFENITKTLFRFLFIYELTINLLLVIGIIILL